LKGLHKAIRYTVHLSNEKKNYLNNCYARQINIVGIDPNFMENENTSKIIGYYCVIGGKIIILKM
jgi:hypothetical protein